MAYGLRVWDSWGRQTFEVTDRLTRYVGFKTVNTLGFWGGGETAPTGENRLSWTVPEQGTIFATVSLDEDPEPEAGFGGGLSLNISKGVWVDQVARKITVQHVKGTIIYGVY